MKYAVSPGLYSLGEPDAGSEVLVTANYRMTFDLLRRSLQGVNVWILVLDTSGINVWCAAGKGAFGTDELVMRVNSSSERADRLQSILRTCGDEGYPCIS
jgi:CO dehydrogenase/acetyl-CoA synthase gamma subunit (corrinoid Fe-S protein)